MVRGQGLEALELRYLAQSEPKVKNFKFVHGSVNPAYWLQKRQSRQKGFSKNQSAC